MKTLFFFLLAVCLAGVACEKETPKNISFTEYSLEETECRWKDIEGAYNQGAVTIINSKEVLESYMECTGESHYPEVDFATHTLLLAHGVERYDTDTRCESVQQLSTTIYVVNVNLAPTLATVITYWHVPIVVGKIPDNRTVKLRITRN